MHMRQQVWKPRTGKVHSIKMATCSGGNVIWADMLNREPAYPAREASTCFPSATILTEIG